MLSILDADVPVEVDDLFDSPSAWDGGGLQALAGGFLPARREQEGLEPADEGSWLERLVSAPVRATQFAAEAAANTYDLTFGDAGVAPRAKPFSVIDDGPQRTVRRYEARTRRAREPIVLIPPLAAPVSCFDLRPGASLVEHLTWLGHRTYVVDYGPIGFSDRELGLEHWVDDVLPKAITAVAEDAGEPVPVCGWCLGGIMSLLTVAAHPEVPVRSLTMIASPFDFTKVSLFEPIRRIGGVTGGAIVTTAYRALGGAPAPLVSLAFRATAIDRYLTRPMWLARNIDNREALAHMRATDRYMSHMLAYPGRTLGQLYHQFFYEGQLSSGKVELGGEEIDFASVEMPVLSIAGRNDVLAPPAAAFAVAKLLPNADVRLETEPGGHLGVLTGTSAKRTTWPLLREFAPAG
ncbi:MAG: alpha/beta hydrolase [Solirubrobacterales bacterium]